MIVAVTEERERREKGKDGWPCVALQMWKIFFSGGCAGDKDGG